MKFRIDVEAASAADAALIERGLRHDVLRLTAAVLGALAGLDCDEQIDELRRVRDLFDAHDRMLGEHPR